MSRYRHALRALTTVFSAVIGSLVTFALAAGPASAQDPTPDGNGSLIGSTSSSGGGLEWWAILLIVVGGLVVIAALAELTRFEIRHHRQVTRPAM